MEETHQDRPFGSPNCGDFLKRDVDDDGQTTKETFLLRAEEQNNVNIQRETIRECLLAEAQREGADLVDDEYIYNH